MVVLIEPPPLKKPVTMTPVAGSSFALSCERSADSRSNAPSPTWVIVMAEF